ncbi:MAG: hypothetical protein WC551_09565 [Patescibacteria group bacterium]|jgi:hypothetical protein
MRIAAYTVLLGSFLSGAADFVPDSQVLQGSALAILGGTIWYILTRAFPAHLKAISASRESFLRAYEKAQDGFLDAQEEARKDYKESLDRVSLAIERVGAIIDGCRHRG